MSSPPPVEPTARITVHSSLRGLASAVLSPLLLLGFGLLVSVAGGLGSVAVLLLGLGLLLAGVTLLDYPRRVEFSPDGVERVCWLRRHHLPWSEVVAIERTPPGARGALRRRAAATGAGGDTGPAAGAAEDRDRGRPSGGLVARSFGRRRYLLTDRVEGQVEYDALGQLLRRLDVATNLRAPRPGRDTPPSDLYRPGSTRRGDDRR